MFHQDLNALLEAGPGLFVVGHRLPTGQAPETKFRVGLEKTAAQRFVGQQQRIDFGDLGRDVKALATQTPAAQLA